MGLLREENVNRKEIEREVRKVAEIQFVMQSPGVGKTTVCLDAVIDGVSNIVLGCASLGNDDKWSYDVGRELAYERAIHAIVDNVLTSQKPKQPKRKCEVRVSGLTSTWVWCDDNVAEKIASLPFVSNVFSNDGNHRHVYFDGRYDEAECIAAIESVNDLQ